MSTAKEGDFVTVIYEGFLENGEIFESSKDTGPLNFQIGLGSVMPCFEEGVVGMKIDETKKLRLDAKDAYGERQEELVQSISRASWDQDADIRPGLVVGINIEKEGQTHQVPAMVTDVQGDMVTIDYNHPLAGKKIIFTITLQEIKKEAQAIPLASSTLSDSDCGCTH